MTVALLVGLLLLIVVGGLSLWQRRAVRDMTSAGMRSRREAPRPPVSDPRGPASPSRTEAVRTDPVVGSMKYDGEGSWHATEAVDFGMGFIDVEFIAGPEGPGAEHTEWMRQAAARWDTLRQEIETLLAARFASSGVTPETLVLYWVRVGPVAGRFEGRIEYVDRLGLLYVRSTDQWRTLTPHMEAREPQRVDSTAAATAPSVADSLHDPELGLLVYDEIDGWVREDDLDFAGAAVSLTVAGTERPGDVHRRWIRVALSEPSALDARARAIVIPELRRRRAAYDDLVAYQMALADVDGATCGYLWYCVGDFSGEIGVSSRDYWRTLALEVVEP